MNGIKIIMKIKSIIKIIKLLIKFQKIKFKILNFFSAFC